MWAYIARQLVQRVFLLFLISFIAFTLLGSMGDPVDILKSTNPNITQREIDIYKQRQGLDKHITLRYFYWLRSAAKGDFGISIQYRRPAAQLLFNRIPNTIYMQAIIMLFIFSVAIPLGIFSAIHQYSKMDYLLTFMAFTGSAMPTFWFALLMILAFGVLPKPGYRLPFTGMYSDSLVVGGRTMPYDKAPLFARFINRIRHLILPVFSVSLISLTGLLRYTRSAMLEVIRQDYVRTARAKGLAERKVIYKHALRNAMIPIATIMIQSIPSLFAGSLIIEQIFGWPGVGKLIYEAVMANDFILAMTAIIFLSSLTVLFTLITDISYAFLDPRITYR
ncbi:MAG TPA: ABC transporter permease [Caldisericia bacterium]|nr:ABC transporter permease [Caldisericia bacterium]